VKSECLTPYSAEVWAVISGKGLIVVRSSSSGFLVKRVSVGACGYHQARLDHVWQNDSPDEELIVFCICYPYLGPVVPTPRGRFAPPRVTIAGCGDTLLSPPRGKEFRIGETPEDVPPDILDVLHKTRLGG
jgi:hypothetical protein